MAIVSTKRTLFDDLGVPDGADAEACRRAWRERVRVIHPDLVSDPAERAKRTAEIARLNAAKDTIVDPNRRAAYLTDIDQARRRAAPTPRPTPAPSAPTASVRPSNPFARTVPPSHTDSVRTHGRRGAAQALPGAPFSAERLGAYLTIDPAGRWFGVGAALVLGLLLRSWQAAGGLEIVLAPVLLLTVFQAIEARSPLDIPAATLLRLAVRGSAGAARLLREAFR
jgi:hypothetical protein